MTGETAHTKLPNSDVMLCEGLLGLHDWNARLSGDAERIAAADQNMARIKEVSGRLSPHTVQTIMMRHTPDRHLMGQKGWPRNPKNAQEMDRFVTAYANQRIAQRKALETVGQFLIEGSESLRGRNERAQAHGMGMLLVSEYHQANSDFSTRRASEHSAHTAKLLARVADNFKDDKNAEAAVLAGGWLSALAKAGREMSETAERSLARNENSRPATRKNEAVR